MIATLDVERFVLGAAVQDVLVAPNRLAHSVDRRKHRQAEPLALMGGGDGDFFYMADQAAVVDAVSVGAM